MSFKEHILVMKSRNLLEINALTILALVLAKQSPGLFYPFKDNGEIACYKNIETASSCTMQRNR